MMSGILKPIHTLKRKTHILSRHTKEERLKIKCSFANEFDLDFDKPLICFIGRMVGEKGADLLPQVIGDSFYHIGRRMNFLILGSGSPDVEGRLSNLKAIAINDYNAYIGYNETLSHVIYAGADFFDAVAR